ncbi:hypothetical protein [Arthrospira platensis]|mgnify:CR=1 FL=1|uniref:Uncharacterized protein n=1 Tax=Limnospira platensis NIES-46 TaxID=1236695 RepID=A0A5M3TC65_LIMPL|nr:hypothetical protein [Arthrospira platensis]AMW31394.1 hypothetical protein AP285_29250 [Arthrospira platensis YZ]KDR56128.1 hypothetical protein APPUASWS_018555 [Arthrospira platensis str. Paraca]MBD2671279.1 hypothetical protein [Arthrospira platensis FACHB-439]MBD2712246.1 hypothetical protein [Arthrospira platensis FACHB-835]MDF2208887.1 hypothetical protein [Arthrospira platensis NCB002]MDT9184850.1 hypothetical protein [Limnospira sp. PMC 289.06]MDT9312566.1 hypothetical protein [Li
MTDKHQRDMRRHAAEEFVKSFQQELLEAFQQENESSEEAPSLDHSPVEPRRDNYPSSPISLSELEEAISDIEQFLESQREHPSSPDTLRETQSDPSEDD